MSFVERSIVYSVPIAEGPLSEVSLYIPGSVAFMSHITCIGCIQPSIFKFHDFLKTVNRVGNVINCGDVIRLAYMLVFNTQSIKQHITQ